MALIDRAVAVDSVQRIKSLATLPDNDAVVRMSAVEYVLYHLPSVEPERPTGTWILVDNQRREDTVNGNYAYICSNCLYTDVHAKSVHVPYCWHCGAKMKEKQNAIN